MNKAHFSKQTGQAAVEYILAAAILITVTTSVWRIWHHELDLFWKMLIFETFFPSP